MDTATTTTATITALVDRRMRIIRDGKVIINDAIISAISIIVYIIFDWDHRMLQLL
jgi:hypothetical protein